MEQYSTLVGIAVQTVIFLLGGYAMVIRNDMSNKNLDAKVESMEKELKGLAKVVIEMAVQTTRVDNLTSQVASIDRRVEDLRRGNGYVQSRMTPGSVDHEY